MGNTKDVVPMSMPYSRPPHIGAKIQSDGPIVFISNMFVEWHVDIAFVIRLILDVFFEKITSQKPCIEG
jgi:hypothetical protein